KLNNFDASRGTAERRAQLPLPRERAHSSAPESLGWLGADRRRPLRAVAHAHVGLHPPDLSLLVDLALADHEAGVEPPVRLLFGCQLDACEDRAAPAGSSLLDALAVDRDEDLLAAKRGDETAQVRRPHAVLAAT